MAVITISENLEPKAKRWRFRRHKDLAMNMSANS
jgi:hypothetical protein